MHFTYAIDIGPDSVDDERLLQKNRLVKPAIHQLKFEKYWYAVSHTHCIDDPCPQVFKLQRN